MKRKNKIRVLCLTCFAAVLIFSSCENNGPKVYTKQSYINHDAVINNIKDPMVNIPWLAQIQKKYDGDKARSKYSAILLFTPKNDSTQYIFDYNHRNDLYFLSPTGTVYNLNGSCMATKDTSTYHDNSPESLSLVTEKTQTLIHNLINEILGPNNLDSKTRCLEQPPQPYMPDPYTIEEIDTILYNANSIEVLSCYKLTENL